jgi:multidrug resistance protein MdtO
MATAAQTIPQRRTISQWFPAFLRDELDFYPGRAGKMARITIACVLTFIAGETFRIPGEVYGVIAVFLVSRDTPEDTIRTTIAGIVASAIGVATVLLGALTFADSQFLYFFFLAIAYIGLFFLIRILLNPVVAPNVIVGFYAASLLWDGRSSPKAQLEGSLWIFLVVSTGLAIACCVELVFVRGSPVEQLLKDLNRRIHAVQEVLLSLAGDGDEVAKRQASEELAMLAVVGTGRLRREMQVITRSHSHAMTYYAELSTGIALTGRLVDATASLNAVAPAPSDGDRQRLRGLAEQLERIRLHLTKGERIEPMPMKYAREASAGVPVLPALEWMVQLFCLSFQPSATTVVSASVMPDDPKGKRIFVNDAFSNPGHVRFAIKGALAATICYIIYSAVDWPGISTAVLTCFLTALSTIGAARQKQLNRITGAVAGGALGIGALVFVLPNIDDSIAWISLVVAVGTVFSAWFATSSPRINYFGMQVALAFYLTLLQGFAEPTSLEPPRDRFVGVLLSIVVMGFVFDRLWPVTAAGEMQREFVATLRNMGRFAELIGEEKGQATGTQIAKLREIINTGFANAHTHADSIKFEFGPEREANLALRDNFLRWATAGRTLYLLELSLGHGLDYQSAAHPVSSSLLAARRGFCVTAGDMLEYLADRVEGRTLTEAPDVQGALGRLETEFANWFAANPEEHQTPATSGILATARQLVTVVEGIGLDIQEHPSDAPLIGPASGQ